MIVAPRREGAEASGKVAERAGSTRQALGDRACRLRPPADLAHFWLR
jgi:hypothetical protein